MSVPDGVAALRVVLILNFRVAKVPGCCDVGHRHLAGHPVLLKNNSSCYIYGFTHGCSVESLDCTLFESLSLGIPYQFSTVRFSQEGIMHKSLLNIHG